MDDEEDVVVACVRIFEPQILLKVRVVIPIEDSVVGRYLQVGQTEGRHDQENQKQTGYGVPVPADGVVEQRLDLPIAALFLRISRYAGQSAGEWME